MKDVVFETSFVGGMALASHITDMNFEVALSRSTLEGLVRELAPIRIHLTKTDEDRSWIELDEPSSVDMVPGRGLRIVCSGRVRYALGPVALPLRIRRVVVVLAPEIVRPAAGMQALAFGIELQEGDLELVPGIVDQAIVNRVNASLNASETPLKWDFGAALAKSFKLPERLEPLDRLELSVRQSSVVAGEHGLRLSIGFGVHVTRTKERPTDD